MRLGHASPERRDTRGCGTRPTYEWWGGWVRATAPAGEGGRAHDLWLTKPTCRPLSYIGSCLLQGTGCGLRAHVGNERGWGLFRTLANASEPVVGRQLQTSRGTSASHTSGPVSRSMCVCACGLANLRMASPYLVARHLLATHPTCHDVCRRPPMQRWSRRANAGSWLGGTLSPSGCHSSFAIATGRQKAFCGI